MSGKYIDALIVNIRESFISGIITMANIVQEDEPINKKVIVDAIADMLSESINPVNKVRNDVEIRDRIKAMYILTASVLQISKMFPIAISDYKYKTNDFDYGTCMANAEGIDKMYRQILSADTYIDDDKLGLFTKLVRHMSTRLIRNILFSASRLYHYHASNVKNIIERSELLDVLYDLIEHALFTRSQSTCLDSLQVLFAESKGKSNKPVSHILRHLDIDVCGYKIFTDSLIYISAERYLNLVDVRNRYYSTLQKLHNSIAEGIYSELDSDSSDDYYDTEDTSYEDSTEFTEEEY